LEYFVIWLQWCARINIIKSSRTVLWPKKDMPWMVAMAVHEVAHFLLTCCILHGPDGERILDVIPGGMELKLKLRRGVGQAAHTCNNPHIKRTGV
jgi:hypothetical protein